MGWSIGHDSNWDRDIGYGVPCKCDHPDCNKKIDRGLAYVCGGEPYGGDLGCGLYFCYDHLLICEVGDRTVQLCERCADDEAREAGEIEPFDPKPDVKRWICHKLTDPSWEQWRNENPDWVKQHSKKPTPNGDQDNAG